MTIISRTILTGVHISEFHCHNNLGRPHQTNETSKRSPVSQPDFNGEPQSTPCADYRVTVKCRLCGKMAVINKDGLVYERIDGF